MHLLDGDLYLLDSVAGNVPSWKEYRGKLAIDGTLTLVPKPISGEGGASVASLSTVTIDMSSPSTSTVSPWLDHMGFDVNFSNDRKFPIRTGSEEQTASWTVALCDFWQQQGGRNVSIPSVHSSIDAEEGVTNQLYNLPSDATFAASTNRLNVEALESTLTANAEEAESTETDEVLKKYMSDINAVSAEGGASSIGSQALQPPQPPPPKAAASASAPLPPLPKSCPDSPKHHPSASAAAAAAAAGAASSSEQHRLQQQLNHSALSLLSNSNSTRDGAGMSEKFCRLDHSNSFTLALGWLSWRAFRSAVVFSTGRAFIS